MQSKRICYFLYFSGFETKQFAENLKRDLDDVSTRIKGFNNGADSKAFQNINSKIQNMKAELKIANQENTLTQETVKSAEESLLQAQIDLNTKASQNQENEKYSSEELSQLLEELESQVEAFDDVLNSAAHESILALISKISDTLERARESEGATKDTIALKEFKLRMQKDILDEKIEENEQKHIEVSSEHGEPEVKFVEDFESMQRKSIKNCIGIIENTMKTYEELKLSVEVFNGTTNDNTYKLLVISLETMIQSLMQIEMSDAHEVREKHGQALVAVQDLLRQLQDQAKATCKTLSIETALFLGNYKKDLKKIESGVESFDHITDSDFYNKLYSQIQNMFLKLEKARGEGTVKPEVLSTIQSLLQKSEKNLKERAVIRERKEKERQEKMNILSKARKCFDENSKNLSYLQNEVSKFQGNSESVQFRFLEDQLTGLMHSLDRVELKDEEELRQEYMSCIAAVQCVLTDLTDKAESFVEHTSTTAQSIPDIAMHCELELNSVIDEIEKTSNTLSKSQINHIFEKLKLIEQHLNQIPEEHATKRENVSSLLQITFKKLDINVNKQNKAKTETLIDQNSYPVSSQNYTKPLQLLKEDDRGEFKLDEEALASVVCREEIRNRKLIVLSVVGEYRRGKSFLLNFIIRYLRAQGSKQWLNNSTKLEGFEWRRDMNRVTTGIMLWPEYFLIKDDRAVILMDTQGTFDNKMTIEQNTFVFALSTLVSSIQIYNVHQRIQLDTLMNLQYFLEYGRLVSQNCSKKPFQGLKILIRDWEYPEKIPYGFEGGKEHLNVWLKDQKSATEMLRTCFEKVDCCLMPYPGDIVAKCDNFNGNLTDISSTFRENLSTFISDIFSPQNLQSKRIGPTDITAKDLLPCMKVFVDNLKNAEQKPATLYELTAKLHHKTIIDHTVNWYVTEMKKKMPEVADIEKLHKSTTTEAINQFDDAKKYGDGNITKEFKIFFSKQLDLAYENHVVPYIQERERVRKSKISNTIQGAIRQHQEKLNECLLGPEFFKLEDVHSSATKEAFKLLKQIKPDMMGNEYDQMMANLKQKTEANFKSMAANYEEKLNLELNKLETQASESYRKQLKELIGSQACQNFIVLHKKSDENVKREVGKQVAKFKKSEAVELLIKRLEKTIHKIRAEYEEQNDILLKVELGKIQREASAQYHQQMQEWIQKSENVSVKKLDGQHEKAKSNALKLFTNIRNNLGKEFCKGEYNAAMKKIAENYVEYKETCKKSGKAKAILLAFQLYRSGMEKLGVKESYLKELNDHHKKLKVQAINSLGTNEFMRDIDQTEIERFEQDMNKLYTEYETFNKKLRQLHMSDLENKFNKYVIERTGSLETELRDGHVKNLNKKLGTIAQEALKIVSVAEESSEEYINLQRKAIEEMTRIKKKMTAENSNKKTQSSRIAALRSYSGEIRQLGLGKTWIEDFEPKVEIAEKNCQNYFLKNAVENSTNFQFEKSELEKETAELSKKFILENQRMREINSEKLNQSITDCIEIYKSKMKDKIVDIVRVLDDLELDTFHFQAKKAALDLYQRKISEIDLPIPSDHESWLLKEIDTLLEFYKNSNAMTRRKQRLEIKSARNEEDYAVGIDLGTTYSCVTVYKGDKFERIKNNHGMFTTPSVVFYSGDDVYVGEDARMRGQSDSKNCLNCISGVKRIIGRRFDDPEVRAFKGKTYFSVVERDGFPRIEVTRNNRKICLKPEEVSAEILKEMKRLAGIHLKQEVHDAVVTIPAYFTEPQRAATLEACRLAEINVLRLFNEPTAAAITYGYQNKSERRRKIVVFDFGGGTCDVSVLEIDGENFIVKASHGDNCLGGQDFDEKLMDYLIDTHLQEKTVKRIDRSRILFECEKAKRKLSHNTEYSMFLAGIAGSDLRATVTRKTFEEINSALFSRALQPIEECLNDANLSKSDIDEVVLAGGSSHMPKMQQMLRHFFDDKPLNASINPDEAIAHGAALQAAILTGQCTIKLSIKDITPFSLGIEVKDNQTEVLISVYQGENVDEADENTKLGKFTLNNVTARKAGETKIDVTFEIDEDGILNVTASEVGMENTNSIVLSKKVN
ncbi:hypothetical protein B566_EDAN014499 [Ephemera danica]|nr:hypothetical protein B566_EDAN014499 [Ephemera danica]